MALASTIEWTEATWNPVVGCRKVSDGCRFCYAERMAARLSAMAKAALASNENAGRKENYARVVTADGRWNGHVVLDEMALDIPLRWRTPRKVFVNSMSDLFHKDVPLDFIQRVFSTMSNSSQHTYQVLTKRPERALELAPKLSWPPNVWLGVSVEDARVIERIDLLRQIPSSIRFLSIEPLLGPLPELDLTGIEWVIVGGESGPHARPVDAEWVREVRDKCLEFNVPFFFKQWGGRNKKASGRVLDGQTWDGMPSDS